MTYRYPLRRSPAHALAAAVLAGALLGGCTGATSSSAGVPPSALSSAGSAPASGSPAESVTGSPAASLPSQTETSWGRIWDAVPAWFPRYTGANPTQTGQGPVSGEFEVPGTVDTVATFYQGGLERAGYSTVALSGPMEDGSRVLDSQGATSGCKVRTTMAPHGATTLVTVLFGAACPFE